MLPPGRFLINPELIVFLGKRIEKINPDRRFDLREEVWRVFVWVVQCVEDAASDVFATVQRR